MKYGEAREAPRIYVYVCVFGLCKSVDTYTHVYDLRKPPLDIKTASFSYANFWIQEMPENETLARVYAQIKLKVYNSYAVRDGVILNFPGFTSSLVKNSRWWFI